MLRRIETDNEKKTGTTRRRTEKMSGSKQEKIGLQNSKMEISETPRQGENRMGKTQSWKRGHFWRGAVPLALLVCAARVAEERFGRKGQSPLA